MKYRPSCAAMSTAKVVDTGCGRAKVNGVQLTRSREWWSSRPGAASKDDVVR
jgi:hypothetical protein